MNDGSYLNAAKAQASAMLGGNYATASGGLPECSETALANLHSRFSETLGWLAETEQRIGNKLDFINNSGSQLGVTDCDKAPDFPRGSVGGLRTLADRLAQVAQALAAHAETLGGI